MTDQRSRDLLRTYVTDLAPAVDGIPIVRCVAKIVLICYRNAASAASADAARRLRRFLTSLCPDNLTPVEPVVAADGRGLILGVFNPADPAAVHDCSAYTGWLERRPGDLVAAGCACTQRFLCAAARERHHGRGGRRLCRVAHDLDCADGRNVHRLDLAARHSILPRVLRAKSDGPGVDAFSGIARSLRRMGSSCAPTGAGRYGAAQSGDAGS